MAALTDPQKVILRTGLSGDQLNRLNEVVSDGIIALDNPDTAGTNEGELNSSDPIDNAVLAAIAAFDTNGDHIINGDDTIAVTPATTPVTTRPTTTLTAQQAWLASPIGTQLLNNNDSENGGFWNGWNGYRGYNGSWDQQMQTGIQNNSVTLFDASTNQWTTTTFDTTQQRFTAASTAGTANGGHQILMLTDRWGQTLQNSWNGWGWGRWGFGGNIFHTLGNNSSQYSVGLDTATSQWSVYTFDQTQNIWTTVVTLNQETNSWAAPQSGNLTAQQAWLTSPFGSDIIERIIEPETSWSWWGNPYYSNPKDNQLISGFQNNQMSLFDRSTNQWTTATFDTTQQRFTTTSTAGTSNGGQQVLTQTDNWGRSSSNIWGWGGWGWGWGWWGGWGNNQNSSGLTVGLNISSNQWSTFSTNNQTQQTTEVVRWNSETDSWTAPQSGNLTAQQAWLTSPYGSEILDRLTNPNRTWWGWNYFNQKDQEVATGFQNNQMTMFDSSNNQWTTVSFDTTQQRFVTSTPAGTANGGQQVLTLSDNWGRTSPNSWGWNGWGWNGWGWGGWWGGWWNNNNNNVSLGLDAGTNRWGVYSQNNSQNTWTQVQDLSPAVNQPVTATV